MEVVHQRFQTSSALLPHTSGGLLAPRSSSPLATCPGTPPLDRRTSPDTHHPLLPAAVLSDPALPQPPLLSAVNGKIPRRKDALTEDTTHNLLDPVCWEQSSRHHTCVLCPLSTMPSLESLTRGRTRAQESHDDNGGWRRSHSPTLSTMSSWLVIKPSTIRSAQIRFFSPVLRKENTSFGVQSNACPSPGHPTRSPSSYWEGEQACGYERGEGWAATLMPFGGSARRRFLANWGDLEKPCLLHTIPRPSTQGPMVAHAIPTHPHSFRKAPFN